MGLYFFNLVAVILIHSYHVNEISWTMQLPNVHFYTFRPEEAGANGPLFLQPCIKYGSNGWYNPNPVGKDFLSKALMRIIKRTGDGGVRLLTLS